MSLTKVLSSFILFGALLISGCDQTPVKTDSMLFREKATKEASVFVKKATNLFTAQVESQPLQHLDSLIVVKHTLRDARNVYLKKKISNWRDPELTALQNRLEALYPSLADASIGLLYEAVDRTATLRAKVEKIRTQPMGMTSGGVGNMLGSLVNDYSNDMDACCLIILARIDELIVSKKGTYKPLNILLRSLGDKLQKMMEEKSYGPLLRDEIKVVEQGLASSTA